MIQKPTTPQGPINLFSSLLRAALLAPPIAAVVFVLAWYTRKPFGGVGEAFGLFGAMFMVMLAITLVVTLVLLLSGGILCRMIPAMATHTIWRALLFGIAGGSLAAGAILLLLQWLPSGSEVFSVAMLSAIAGGIVAGLAAESVMKSSG